MRAAQSDWISEADPKALGLDIIGLGNWVRTSYGTGPYQIVHIHGPCCCPEPTASINGKPTLPGDLHFHLIVKGERGEAYLNGYTREGRSIWWSRDSAGKVCFDQLISCPPQVFRGVQ